MFKSLLLRGRAICLLLACLLSSLVVTAQTKVTGKVVGSDDKQPVVGASVRVKGTTVGALTDVNGNFSVNASTNSVLVFTYIGYTAKEVVVTGSNLGTITLQATNSTLNEVVVTGYTTQRKKDIAGAVAVVDVTDAKKITSSTSDQLLQGQASGVTVINSGAPGSPSNVFIRGVSNLGDSGPLYVIDGVQSKSMAEISPSDIESISVLKDAGSAAIYGVAGGNGVIVVTTKKGRSGKTIINYDGYYGTQRPIGGNVFNIATPAEQSKIAYLAGDASTYNKIYPGGAGTVPVYGYQGPGAAGVADASFDLSKYHFDEANPSNDFLIQKFNQAGTDWFHEIFKPAPIQRHNISASGGNNKNTYFFSLDYLNQQGTLLNTYEKKYTTRVNTTFSLSDHVRIGESGAIYYRLKPYGDYGNQSEGNAISYAYRILPQIPVYDISGVQFGGTYDGPGGEPLGNAFNPVAAQRRTANNYDKVWNIQGNLFAEVDFAKHFTARTSIGGEILNDYNYGINYNPYNEYEAHAGANGAYENAYYNSRYNWTNTITYKQIFGKNNLSAVVGYEAKQYYARGVGGSGTDLFSVNPSYVNLSTAVGNPSRYSFAEQPNSTLSLFARVDYVFNDKYIIGGTVRRDGYSAFYSGRQYGTFPAGVVAWRISQEDFLKGVSWINDLKLRASYGIAGNNANVPGSNAFSLYGGGPGSGSYPIGGSNALTPGFFNSFIGNVKTSWESDKIANAGIDATLFNNRLDFSFEIYKKSISGLLYSQPLPSTVGGANAPFVNLGDNQNKGVDLSVTYHGNVGSEFKYMIGANITTYKNTLANIPGGYLDVAGSRVDPIVREATGHSIGEFYGYKVIGFYSAADIANASIPKYAGAQVGAYRYADVNGDGKIDANDKTFIGNPNPKYTYGVDMNASYKGFDISMIFYGSQGNKDFHYTNYFTNYYASFAGAKSKDLLYKSYGAPGVTNPTLPAANLNNSLGTTQISTAYIENGSFLKLRVAQIGYNFAPAMLKSVGISKAHVYIQGTNLFTITKYTGLDPELPPAARSGNLASASYGIDFGSYPANQRQFILGVNLSF